MRMGKKRSRRKAGFVWHCWHNKLISYYDGYNRRVGQIKDHKPANQHEVRLERFQFVKGPVPDYLTEHRCEWNVAEHLKQNHPRDYERLLAKHEKQCPDCPWNGRTLFPRKKGGA